MGKTEESERKVVTGDIEEKIIDNRFENMRSEIKKNTEQEN